MTELHPSIEQPILLVTSQPESLLPMVSVIRTILQQNPELAQPHQMMELLSTRSFHLLIIDIYKQDILPLIRSCKERFPNVPIIAIVPYGDVNRVEHVIEQGADDYISQPISLERLKITLRNALRLHALFNQSPAILAHKNVAHSLSPLLDHMGKLKTLKEIEDAVISYAITNFEGCITQAAKALGIGRSTLYRKMQEKIDERSGTLV